MPAKNPREYKKRWDAKRKAGVEFLPKLYAIFEAHASQIAPLLEPDELDVLESIQEVLGTW